MPVPGGGTRVVSRTVAENVLETADAVERVEFGGQQRRQLVVGQLLQGTERVRRAGLGRRGGRYGPGRGRRVGAGFRDDPGEQLVGQSPGGGVGVHQRRRQPYVQRRLQPAAQLDRHQRVEAQRLERHVRGDRAGARAQHLAQLLGEELQDRREPFGAGVQRQHPLPDGAPPGRSRVRAAVPAVGDGQQRGQQRAGGRPHPAPDQVGRGQRGRRGVGAAGADGLVEQRHSGVRVERGHSPGGQPVHAAARGGECGAAPGAPVDALPRQPLGGAQPGQGVQEGVGRGVGGLAGRADQAGQRGEHHEQFQRLVAGQLVQVPRAGRLAGLRPRQRRGVEVGQQRVLQHPRQVRDAPDGPAGGGQYGAQRLAVGEVDARGRHRAAGGRREVSHRLAGLGRGRAAPQEEQVPGAAAGQPGRCPQAQRAQAAGHDVHAVAVQRRVGRRGPRHLGQHRLGQDAVAQGELGGRFGGAQRRGQRRERGGGRLRREVHEGAADLGVLVGEGPAQAPQGGARGYPPARAGRALGVRGEHPQAGRRLVDLMARQALYQGEQSPGARRQRRRGVRGLRCPGRWYRAGVEDAPQRAARLGLGPGEQGVGGLVRPRRGSQGPAAGALGQRGQPLPQRRVLGQHQPGALRRPARPGLDGQPPHLVQAAVLRTARRGQPDPEPGRRPHGRAVRVQDGDVGGDVQPVGRDDPGVAPALGDRGPVGAGPHLVGADRQRQRAAPAGLRGGRGHRVQAGVQQRRVQRPPPRGQPVGQREARQRLAAPDGQPGQRPEPGPVAQPRRGQPVVVGVDRDGRGTAGRDGLGGVLGAGAPSAGQPADGAAGVDDGVAVGRAGGDDEGLPGPVRPQAQLEFAAVLAQRAGL
nr:hypothetical protein [Actinacidiphila yeochonensis]